MATKRLDDMRDNSRALADLEDGAEFLPDAELTRYVNEGIVALYNILLDADEAMLYAINGSQLVSVGDFSWQLPSNFMRLVSLSVNVSDEYYPARRADVSEYEELASRQPDEKLPRYLLRKEFGTGTAELYIFPEGQLPEHIGYTYIPAAPELSLDADTFVGPLDHHEYIENYAAAKMAAKEQEDVAPFLARQDALADTFRNATSDVDANSTKTVRNLRRRRSNRRDF